MTQEQQVPQGVYCYDGKGCCPHWRRDGQWVYCELLKIANEPADAPEPTVPHAPGYEHQPMALLWDQVKECGVNDDINDDVDEPLD